MTTHHPEPEGLRPETLASLVDAHGRFLAFLERRVGNRADAEEILQAAFVRSLDAGDSLREGESATAWFYRLLRNAVVDHWRRRAAEQRALDRAGSEPLPPPQPPDEEMMDAVCGCVAMLVDTLKPEYGRALRRIDMGTDSIAELASEEGITPNNARVRLHRAREALRRQVAVSCGTCAVHGCLDCHCGKPASP